MKMLLLIPLLCLMAWSCGEAKKPPIDSEKDVIGYEATDPKMNAAIAEAKKTLPDFLKRLPKLDKESSMVKWAAPVGGSDREHIWVNHLEYKDGWFTGDLANEPDNMPGKKMGDHVRFQESDVSDWIIFKPDNTYEGGYTQKVMEEGELKGRDVR